MTGKGTVRKLTSIIIDLNNQIYLKNTVKNNNGVYYMLLKSINYTGMHSTINQSVEAIKERAK